MERAGDSVFGRKRGGGLTHIVSIHWRLNELMEKVVAAEVRSVLQIFMTRMEKEVSFCKGPKD